MAEHVIDNEHDDDAMSPESSPGKVPKSGVRRVNNLPLIIAGAAMLVFVLLIAMVAVKRSQQQQAHVQNDVEQATKKNTSTATMAADVVGGRDAGLIAPDAPAKPVAGPVVPVASTGDLDKPPVPPSGGTSEPQDPAATAIQQAKMQQFEEAVKAKTAIALPNYLATDGNPAASGHADASTPRTRDEMLARIADVRRQLAQTASTDPNAAYQKQLALIKSSMHGGGGFGGSGGVSGAGAAGLLQGASSDGGDPSGIQQFAGDGSGDRWSLNTHTEAPKPFELRAGAVIPGVMISGVNSDLPGQIMGQVSQDVYDTATGKYLLIPQGSRLIGTYSSNIAYGQNAVLIAWQRIMFPDGKVRDIGAMPGADAAGYAGFRDKVNNHYVRIFASALLMSGVTAGVAYSQDKNNNSGGLYSNPTASSELSQALGQQLGQVTGQMVAKNLNIAPTIEIRPGYRFNIIAVKDITFKKPYQSFDY